MAKNNKNTLETILDNSQLDKYLKVFPNKVGSQGFDAWGFNIRNMKSSIQFIKFLYETYFRVEAFGLENIPKNGRCLIIPNHSGQLPIDGMLVGYAMITNDLAPRAPKAMVERFLPTVPFIGNWLNSLGAVIGDTVNCERMLENEEAVVVFPEGAKGSGKTFDKRYKLQRFGNGFMYLAMQHKAPIIPVGIVGCEESIISVTNMPLIAKLFSMPYAPLVIPAVLPAKVFIYFGEPIYFENDVHSEHDIKERVNIVKAEVKKLVDLGLAKRKSVFEK